KPDLSKEMQTSIPFSGGPWKLQSWSTRQTVLVPNDNYWVKNSLGRPTYFDQVTIVPRTDSTAEVGDLLSGAIDAIFPQPMDPNMVDQVMTAGGYAKDSKGFWAKHGRQVKFTYDTTLKPHRIQTQTLLKEGLTAAGFNVTFKSEDSALLFETKIPHGDFQIADF